MTPAERARQIDAEEFRRDSERALARALAYSKQKRDAHRRQFLTFAFGDAGKSMATDRHYIPTNDNHAPQPVYTYKTRTMSAGLWAIRLRTDEEILRRHAQELGSMEAAIKYFSSKLKLKRKAQLLTHAGLTLTRKQWAGRLGITVSALSKRIANVGPDAALVMGKAQKAGVHLPHADPNRITFNGLSLTRQEWADHLGITYNSLCQRIHRYGFEAAIMMRSRRTGRTAPGVSPNFHPIEGTGAGAVAQETPNITLSEDTKP